MQLVAPDILAEARGLSVAVCTAGLGLGLLLWLLGGWAHRFWMALLTTLAAGVYGLSIGAAYGVQPLVAGVLLAVAAGALALSLVRVFAFAAGGLAVCLAAERLVPSWNEPFAFFFLGGFLGLFLLRYWLMVLTSLAGTLLMAYSGLWLLDRLGKLDAVAFSAGKPVLLNWACGCFTLLGLVAQLYLDRRWRKGAAAGADDKEDRAPRARKLLSWLTPADEGKKNRRAA